MPTRTGTLYARLTDDGVDAWLDKEKLLPGQDWELEIKKAVREADVVVVCLSMQFNQAGFRQKEVRLALDTAMEKPEGEIFIIPARLEECDNLESLRRWHWVDLFEDDGYEMLMRAFRAQADRIGMTLQIKKPSLPVISKDVFDKLIPLLRVVVIMLIVGATLWGGSQALPQFIASISTAKATATEHLVVKATSTNILAVPTKTPRPNPTQTKELTTSTPFGGGQVEISDAKGVKMVLVPEGEFTMGNDAYRDEEPAHIVKLAPFYIDKYEVTNALYSDCVQEGACKLPVIINLYGVVQNISNYYGQSQYSNYPVVNVDWNMAKDLCTWRESSLPTEAEWEKSARGKKNNSYPWGNNIDCSFANYAGICEPNLVPVNRYETGKSPYGAYNMAGNVAEWTADWYSENYYTTLPAIAINPQGPISGIYHVVRGGSWRLAESYLRVTSRGFSGTSDYSSNIGFRCVHSVP